MKNPIKASLLLAALVLVPGSVLAQSPERPNRPDQGGPMGQQPGLSGELKLRTDRAFEGYTLLAPLRSTSTYLLDLDGEPVHEWKSQYTPGQSVYLLENGHLLRCCHVEDNPVFRGGGSGGRIQEQAWDGTVLWDYEASSEHGLQHHDIEPLPNGNVLVISYELKTQEEAVKAGRDPKMVTDRGLWPDYVFEVEPLRPDGGKVVWEWHAFDHLIQDFDSDAENYGDVTAHPERIDINADHRSEPPMDEKARRAQEAMLRRMRELGYVGDDEGEEQERDRRRGGPRTGTDWLHTNAVSYLPEYDLIALSIHTLSEIWVIDHSTTTAQAAGTKGGRYGHGGDLLYRWGNPRMYGAGNDANQRLFRQHDVRWLDADDGKLHVTVFNNGEGRYEGHYSSVDELVLPFDAEEGFTRKAGEAFGPEEPCWSYSTGDETFFSNFISGAHRLPNGNTLICSGAQNRVFEVTEDGEVVWDYYSAAGGGERGPRGRGRGDGPPDWRGGPPGGFPPGDGPPDDGDRGGDAGGERGAGPGRRGPRGRQGGPFGGPGHGPGGGPGGLFRATRIAIDYPGLAESKARED